MPEVLAADLDNGFLLLTDFGTLSYLDVAASDPGRVDALYADLQQRGAKIDYELHDKPYGCREFGIQDLDGHDIAFGQNLDDD